MLLVLVVWVCAVDCMMAWFLGFGDCHVVVGVGLVNGGALFEWCFGWFYLLFGCWCVGCCLRV